MKKLLFGLILTASVAFAQSANQRYGADASGNGGYFASGDIGGSAATSATSGTMSVPMTSAIITITPTAACTFQSTGGVTGQIVTFWITTSGTSAFTLTWSTNYKPTGTLSTGTVSAKQFLVTFRCVNGTQWSEMCRTVAE